MIPSTFTLFVAATSTVLSANALPIFSGFFGAPAAAAPLQTRDTTNLTDGQLAQGTNAFFSTLLLEDVCTPGQVACINNNTATCSPEANWEITPCPSSTTCLAIPASTTNTTSQDLIVTCTNPTTALAAIEQAGGSQALAVDFNITTAPFNTTVVDDPNTDGSNNSTTTGTDVPTSTDSSVDAPTGTDDTSVPTATCTPDDGSNDGSDDGSNDGSDDGSNDGSDDGSTDPTGTDAASDPTATCTEDPSAEPTETEFITVIAFPDPTDSSQFSYSTLEPTETLPADVTDATDVPTPTDTFTDADATATSTDYTCTETATDSAAPTDSADPTDTTTDTDTAAPTTTDTADTGAPTTLVVPPNFSVSGPVPDISALGTFEIPAASVTVSTPVPIRRRGMIKKVRRST